MFALNKKTKDLSVEDKKIWESFVKSDLIKKGRRVDNPVKTKIRSAPLQAHKIKEISPSKVTGNIVKTNPSVDKKIHIKLKKGHLRPERTLDLHGLTYDNAYSQVLLFIRNAYHDQKRLILVITGKGNSTFENESFFSNNRRGVLNQAFPKWIEDSTLKPLVLNIRSAHVSHGGKGAYYVYLRKKKLENKST